MADAVLGWEVGALGMFPNDPFSGKGKRCQDPLLYLALLIEKGPDTFSLFTNLGSSGASCEGNEGRRAGP